LEDEEYNDKVLNIVNFNEKYEYNFSATHNSDSNSLHSSLHNNKSLSGNATDSFLHTQLNLPNPTCLVNDERFA
jgi:hypothetical protein